MVPVIDQTQKIIGLSFNLATKSPPNNSVPQPASDQVSPALGEALMNKHLTFKPDLADRIDTTIKKKKAVVALLGASLSFLVLTICVCVGAGWKGDPGAGTWLGLRVSSTFRDHPGCAARVTGVLKASPHSGWVGVCLGEAAECGIMGGP